jgi:hypothetical protein
MARPTRSHGPADDSNRYLAHLMAGIPRTPPEEKPPGGSLSWGVIGTAVVAAIALGWGVYWTILR